ncbi:glycosyltransferase [Paraburkholderia sp. RL17-383-BIF-A]|uniref:glycosyltransferase family 2 protein n=1 Tax=Paraburkholderia sp. RL17-383-BIF-A TaxID=3031631 RepID=UPI0038BDAF7E
MITKRKYPLGAITDVFSGAAARIASNGGVGRSLRAVGRLIRREGWRGALRKIARVSARQSGYQRWVVAYDSPQTADLGQLQAEVAGLMRKPLISIVVPVYNTPAQFLADMIQSVLDQVYPDWELCIADDASSELHVREMLVEYARKDPRIRVVFRAENGHICEASNSAVELATGEYIALLDHDDVLPKHALAMVVKYINAHPEGRIFYSDEDKISAAGQRSSPYFKGDWDPELITQQNFFSHLGVFETQVVRGIGGFRKGLEGSQDHDLVLRSVRAVGNEAVVHIPHVLYHWRTIEGSTAVSVDEKPYAVRASVTAIADHLAAQRINAEVVAPSKEFPFVRIDYGMPRFEPGVHIVISSSGNTRALGVCLKSVFANTRYANYRISIVALGTKTDADWILAMLPADAQRMLVCNARDTVEAAEIINDLVTRIDCECVCLLDENVEIKTGQWLDVLLSHAMRETTGLAGPLLCKPDGTVCAAGMVMMSSGTAAPAQAGIDSRDIGYFGRAVLTHVVSALPNVCVVARREVLLSVGGVGAGGAGSLRPEVGLSLRVAAAGLRNILAPTVRVVFSGSVGNTESALPEGGRRSAAASNAVLSEDRSYNPNLALSAASATFELSFPPRIDRFG